MPRRSPKRVSTKKRSRSARKRKSKVRLYRGLHGKEQEEYDTLLAEIQAKHDTPERPALIVRVQAWNKAHPKHPLQLPYLDQRTLNKLGGVLVD